jgi:pilus assembly protein Flp/PilA
MKQHLLQLKSKIQILLYDDGQDLIEYALVVALIAFAATVGMGNVANGINNAFSTISSKLTATIT